MFNGSENEKHELFKNLHVLHRSPKYWLQERSERRDVTKGFIMKELQSQAMGNGLKYMGFEVNFVNKGFLSC